MEKEELMEILVFLASPVRACEEVQKHSSVQTVILVHYVMDLLLQLLTCFFYPQDDELVIAPWPVIRNRLRLALFHLLQVGN